MDEHFRAGFVKQLSINPPTEKEIEKVLFEIAMKEGLENIAMNKHQITDIK